MATTIYEYTLIYSNVQRTPDTTAMCHLVQVKVLYVPLSIFVRQLLAELPNCLITRCLLQLTLLQSVQQHNVMYH